MTVTRIDKNRPVIYKNYVIHVNKDIRGRYIFRVRQTMDVELSGVTETLESAFEEARKIIDKMTEGQ
jgi:hypothetical protein